MAQEPDELSCFFHGQGPCDGALICAHLIPQQLLRREFPHGVLFDDGRWRKATRYEDRYDLPHRTATDLCNDVRSWVPCCGGPQGNGGHHHQLDHSKKLRIAREELPEELEQFAAELGLTWFIQRTYNERKVH